MVTRIGKYIIFYRHFFYGSALCVGTCIGGFHQLYNPIVQICLIVSLLLMATSIGVTYIVNKYPEEFQNEMRKRTNDVSDELE